MAELSEKGISYSGAFFMLIALAFGGMLLGGIIATPVVMMMSGKGLQEVLDVKKMMGNPAYFREMQVMQSISAIFGFLVPTIFSASLLSKRPLELIGFKGNITAKQAVLTVAIIVVGVFLSSALAYTSYQIPFPAEWKKYFAQMENDYIKTAINLINLNNVFELFISIIVLALVPAVCEEALFRGGFQNYLYRATKNQWLAVIVVSLIFSAVHFSAYGFLSRLMLGVVLGLIYHYSGKLWLSILAHFINNAAAVLIMYQQKTSGRPMAEIMGDKEGSYLGLLAIPLLIFLFIQFKKENSSNLVTHGI